MLQLSMHLSPLGGLVTNKIHCLASCDTKWNNIDTMQLYRMQTDERITQDASVINAPFSLKKSGD